MNDFEIESGELLSYSGSESRVIIPDGVEVISDCAFDGNENITEVVIPDGVIAIESAVFKDCKNLESVRFPDSLECIVNGAFVNCISLKSIYIPDGVTLIGSSAFKGCSALSEVRLPHTLTKLGGGCFEKCTALKSITVPGNVKKLSAAVFSECISLEEVIISEGVEEIRPHVFYGCSSLERITFPDSVEKINFEQFNGCVSLTEIAVGEGNRTYKTVNGDLYSRDGRKLMFYAPGKKEREFTVPSGVEEIGFLAFLDCGWVTDVIIPEGVTAIERYAFAFCPSLERVVFPKGIKTVGEKILKDCPSLREVFFPESEAVLEKDSFCDIPLSARLHVKFEVFRKLNFPNYLWRSAVSGFLSDYFSGELDDEEKEKWRSYLSRRTVKARNELAEEPLLYRYLIETNHLSRNRAVSLLETVESIECRLILIDYAGKAGEPQKSVSRRLSLED